MSKDRYIALGFIALSIATILAIVLYSESRDGIELPFVVLALSTVHLIVGRKFRLLSDIAIDILSIGRPGPGIRLGLIVLVFVIIAAVAFVAMDLLGIT